MADRYWVGGTGDWDATSTANWSASSGGGTGASVPTAADNVFFDANSNVGTGAFTVTMLTSRVCNDFTASGLDGVMTLAGSGLGLTVSGSLTFQATNFSVTYNGATTFNATSTGKTVTTNGVSFNGNVNFNGVGGGWTLGSALTLAGSTQLSVTNGTFDTSSSGNYAVTAQNFVSSASTARTLNLNASTLTFSNAFGTAWNMATSTNATLNAGTSTITITPSTPTFSGGGLTYYNVSFTSTAQSSGIIAGANTFNNLTITGRTTVGINSFSFSANQTINGTLTVSAGTASAYRTFIASNVVSTTRTLTCAAVSLTDVDFIDITIAGAASPASGTRLGDCKGNSGITFGAGKTVYYRQTGSANWGTTGSGSWSATSGGALDATQFPLAQDTAVFPAATYPASGSVTTIPAAYNIGTIDMSLRTSNTMTLATGSTAPFIYGNWINGTGIYSTGSGVLTFAGRTTQTITNAGKDFQQPITINSPSGSVTLQDNFKNSVTAGFTLTSGTLSLQSFTLETALFSSSNSNTRTIAFGTGNIKCTDTGTVWNTATVTGLTTTGTQVVNITNNTGGIITVSTGALSEANSISFNFTGGTYALTFLNTGSVDSARSVDFTGYAGTLGAHTSQAVIYGNLKYSTGMTLPVTTNQLRFGGTSGTQQITTNGKTLTFPVLFSGVGGTFQLQDAMTLNTTSAATLTNGTLSLQSFTLSSGTFNSDNSNTRTLAFGTGNITVTGTGIFTWASSTTTGFTTTGTRIVNVTSVGSTGITITPGALSEANSISFNFTGGTYALTFLQSASHTARNVDFTGYAGTLSSSSGSSIIYGNLTLSTGMTLTASGSALSFRATSGTQQITSNGKTMDFPLTFDGVGGTFQLQDALTMGSTRTATLTNGTLNLNGKTFTVGTAFTTATGTKNLTFNAGTLVCPTAATTAFNNAAPTNFTTTAGTGTGTISMTAATAKTFVGGGSTFNCTLNQGGLGALTITGSNTFSNITNTVQPASILFTAGTTSTFSSFSLSGTAGNLITIGSVTAASHTLSKASGTVSVSFCSISRSDGTGGATWEALTTNGNVNGGNNTGWDFGGVIYAAVIDETATATDAFLSLAAFLSVLAEIATATDSPSVAASTFNAPVAETATATDSPLVAPSTFNAPVIETATATDSVLSLASFLSALSEATTATDSPGVAASTFNAPVAETATATDSVIGLADFYAALSETATATDAVLSFADFFAALAETATATDSPLVAPSTFNAPVAETATATDSPLVAPSTFNAPVSETVTISDLVLGAYLWNLIDDSQSVTWQNVNSSPGTTWSPIDTDPNTGWTDISTVN